MALTGGRETVSGKALPHDSAVKHVSGHATYVDDVREPEGTLHLAPAFARNCVHGRILSLDLDAALAVPGVLDILTAKDIPGINDCSPSMGDDPVLADEIIHFHGQVVCLVLAETREAARRAASRVSIEVEDLPAALTVDDALANNASLLPDYQFERGDPSATIKASAHQVESRFYIGGQEHFYLEGQVAMALPGEDGDMTVLSSTQHPSEVQHSVAKVLNTIEAAITVEVRRMGGAFGGKESQANQWAALAALAAHKTGRPCKLRLDRDDDMIMTGKRHDFRVDLAAGFDENGKLTATELQFASRCGYSADLSLGINDRTMFHADNCYYYPQTTIRSKRLRTNTVSNTAFRGFGGPQGMLAAERLMDTVAITLGKDPLDVRYANLYSAGRDLTPYGMVVEEHALLKDLMETLEADCAYRTRREEVAAFNGENRFLKKGLALTPVKFGISFTLTHLNQAGALVHLYRDGSVHLNHGGTEMGQGLYQKVAQIAADEMGVSLDKVKITAANTSKVPNTSPTAASSGTDLNGMAVVLACREIKGRMLAFAARHYDVVETEIHLEDNRVYFEGQNSMSVADLARAAYSGRVSLSAAGYYATPKINWERETQKGRPFFYFAYGAACAEVTVDTLTGENRVDRVDVIHDVGRSINPAIDIGQIEGGFVQGMGWLTTEELCWDKQGRFRTHAPSTYKIPTATDVPEAFHVKLYESKGNPEETVFNSKAVGEPPLMLPISVHCAINDAISSLKPGFIPRLNAPATPEAILSAVHEIRRGVGS
ncbi:xanthine dehydrogenase molybdopterin binding subunit [Pseudovibrio exalbescens]|uniref:xanthine dehydrogenase molybdopterin binding subunit n=1 Tax=Pseudovibrio exalbescens TaxID=197461 RepID=UPI0023651CC7|nr:xanthine dehydrogenase molybdopterin binding subunit [Pseudovibrio exalbescens]MDD7908801.1 xanthine dehydrogenase molybdopterin binding subunit [Pseudovibrio exalbescens]